MSGLFIKIYEKFTCNRRLYFAILAMVFAILVLRTLTLQYSEDIYDFLPLDKNHQKSLSVYQNITSSDKVVVIFEQKGEETDPDYIVGAMEEFNGILLAKDSLGYFDEPLKRFDYSTINATTDVIYDNIPFCLSEEDYDRLDTLITREFIRDRIAQAKKFLMMPTSTFLSSSLKRDPLSIFLPAVQQLQKFGGDTEFEIYDGYIFSPDKRISIGMVTSPFGGSETSNNTALVAFLNEVVEDVQKEYDEISVHITGAPVIAVGNASQIKRDSFIAVLMSIILILALLLYSFRRWRTLFFISISIFFGWLFAMAGLSLFGGNVSMIVLGIASVIIGIAVNYPLHLIAHLNHTPSIKESLKEIVSPLLIGNITTVGAFLSLVPMNSIALRDLGIFSSFMLIGSIIFVLIFLPPLLKENKAVKERYILPSVSKFQFDSRGWIIIPVLAITLVLGYFGRYTRFNVEMQSINYMTPEQRADFKKLNLLKNPGEYTQLYVVSEGHTLDEALKAKEEGQGYINQIAGLCDSIAVKSISGVVPSLALQAKRVERWNRLMSEKGELLGGYLKEELISNGFKIKAFAPFFATIEKNYECGALHELYNLELFNGHISRDSVSVAVVDILSVPDSLTHIAKEILKSDTSSFHFDEKSLSSKIAQTLSDEFDYICLACGIIVFIFLWLSFGRLELSIMAFLPMAISWVWILGIMGILGIEFNIVNIILATFIFGQGDDYTIFITEGIIYEYTYRKKILASYKNSIILSALIMFAGIGTLIFAKHPALRSLAEVTIVGMITVVVISYIVPPIIFRFLTHKGGEPRLVPLTIAHFIRVAIVYPLMPLAFLFEGRSGLRAARLLCRMIPGVKFGFPDRSKNAGCVVLYRKSSSLDKLLLKATYTDPLLVGIDSSTTVAQALENVADMAVRYSAAVEFVSLNGAEFVSPSGSFFINGGEVRIIRREVHVGADDFSAESAERLLHEMEECQATPEVYKDYIATRYLYKGHNFCASVGRNLRKSGCYSEFLASCSASGDILARSSGLGEAAILLAKVYRDRKIYLFVEDEDLRNLTFNLSHLPMNLFLVRSFEEFDTLLSSGEFTQLSV